MRHSMRALVSGAVQSSQIAVVAGMLLAFALPIRPAAAQQLVDDSTLSARSRHRGKGHVAVDGKRRDPPGPPSPIPTDRRPPDPRSAAAATAQQTVPHDPTRRAELRPNHRSRHCRWRRDWRNDRCRNVLSDLAWLGRPTGNEDIPDRSDQWRPHRLCRGGKRAPLSVMNARPAMLADDVPTLTVR